MTAKRRTIGTVEAAYRAWIRGLGVLSPRQAATAAHVYALAEQLDAAKGRGEPLSAVATVSRELRTAAGDLRTVASVAPSTERAKSKDSVDEVAKRRAARRAAR